MINIHILGNGTPIYALKSLIEVNSEHFPQQVQVTCFGDHFLNSIFVRKLQQYPSIDDIIQTADIVVCTEPDYENLGIVQKCQDLNKPLFCRFLLLYLYCIINNNCNSTKFLLLLMIIL